MTQKKKTERYVTPRGVAVWPRLNEPDTKFKPEGEFTVKLRFEDGDAEAQALVTKLERIRDEEFAKYLSENPKMKKTAKAAPIAKPEVDDDGEETGFFTLNFKMKHKIKSKKTGKTFTLTPDIYDAKKNLLKNPPKIGGGSTLRVSFELGGGWLVPASKEFHLTLRLIGAQIIDLVEFGQRSADSHGFDDEDDGYEAGDSNRNEASDTEDEADGDTNEDDDSGDGDY